MLGSISILWFLESLIWDKKILSMRTKMSPRNARKNWQLEYGSSVNIQSYGSLGFGVRK